MRIKEITWRMIAVPDSHGEFVDKAALNCVCHAIEIVQPDELLHLGDVGEWDAVNQHDWKRKKQDPDPASVARDIRQDAVATDRFVLKPLEQACAYVSKVLKKKKVKKTMITGNHDFRLDRFVDCNPDYADTKHDVPDKGCVGYRFDQMYDWGKRGWQVVPFGKRYRVGQLYFYHGHFYGGMHHDTNHLRKLGVNVMYGHYHDVKYDSMTHEDGTKGAWCMGTLKRIDYEANDWLQRRPVNWSQAFAIIDFWGSKGYFTVHSINIINGRCSIIDRVLDGRVTPKSRKLK